jgi:hypothetical protein
VKKNGSRTIIAFAVRSRKAIDDMISAMPRNEWARFRVKLGELEDEVKELEEKSQGTEEED